MAKYSKGLLEKIVRLIEEDTFTISEICEALSISRKTFYEWKKVYVEFEQAIDEAMDRRDEKLIELARVALKKRLEGYTVTEERVIYTVDKDTSEVKEKARTVRERHIPPSMSAIRFILQKDRDDRDLREFRRRTNNRR